jgi:predicted enzyme related to lactoylglutathione lyase
MTTSSLPATAIAGTDLIGPIVADFNRSLAFYRDLLGMQPSVESGNGAEFHLADGMTFGIWQAPAESGMKPAFNVMFTVADAKAATERYRELGAAASDAMESEVCFMSFATDPEGNSFTLHQQKKHSPHNVSKSEFVHGIDITGYIVSDPAGEMAYYQNVLGLKPTSTDDEGRGAEYTLSDGSTFGVWKGDSGQPVAGFVMFAVDDTRATVAKLRERGVTFATDVMETPVCIMAPTMDPDGNIVIIHQRKQP